MKVYILLPTIVLRGCLRSQNKCDRTIESVKITGDGLRPLLWDTATAITAMGGEAISRDELAARLIQDSEDENFKDIDGRIAATTDENILSRSIIIADLKQSWN